MGAVILPSFYYTYDFVSPQEIFAEVTEEMKSYFITGVIDDTMFPVYIKNALSKLGRTSLKIDETLIELENKSACLPEDFKYVREIWTCNTEFITVPDPRSIYSTSCYQIGPYSQYDRCEQPPPPACSTQKQAVYKTSGELVFTFEHHLQLKPASGKTLSSCAPECQNRSQSGTNTFYIDGNRISTTAQTSFLHLIYYKLEFDESDFQLIPDNYRIKEYLKAFIKFKMYEQIFNEVSDETFNQVERKYQIYKQEYLEAFILADAEIKKETLQQKINSIHAARRRMHKYIIR